MAVTGTERRWAMIVATRLRRRADSYPFTPKGNRAAKSLRAAAETIESVYEIKLFEKRAQVEEMVEGDA